MGTGLKILSVFFITSPLLSHSIKTIKANHPATEKIIFYSIGNRNLPLKITQFGKRNDIVCINLHDDELTSVEAAKKILREQGGTLIEIENKQQRNIRFSLNRSWCTFDPNCIFSKEGIKKYLDKNSRFSKPAATEIERLGKRILQLIPPDVSCVIALHNNTDGLYSALSYKEGAEKEGDAAQVHINSANDADNFFLITDVRLFEQLSAENYNVILQDNEQCADDGSLSVYCGKKNIRYVNIETEHGKISEYVNMLSFLTGITGNVQ